MSDLNSISLLIKSGRKDEARLQLTTYLKQHPQDADAWFLTAAALTDPERQIAALRKALQVNPKHTAAQKMLTKLQPDSDMDGLLGFSPTAAARSSASDKSYTTAAVVVLILYFVLFIPGYIANGLYLKEAVEAERSAGHPLPGVSTLRRLRVVGFVFFLLWLAAFACWLLGATVRSYGF